MRYRRIIKGITKANTSAQAAGESSFKNLFTQIYFGEKRSWVQYSSRFDNDPLVHLWRFSQLGLNTLRSELLRSLNQQEEFVKEAIFCNC